MTHVLRIAHLRIALHVANPEVGNREDHHPRPLDVHFWSKSHLKKLSMQL